MLRRKQLTPQRLSNTGYVAAYKRRYLYIIVYYNTDQSYKIIILHEETNGCLCVPLQAGAEISTVNPEQYSKRFHDFITNILS